MISGYNGQEPHVKNLFEIVAKEIKLYGFLTPSLLPRWGDDFSREIPPLVASGELKYLEDVKHGLKYAGDAIYEMQTGQNHGKSIIKVAEE